ncbi:MAG TPA: O-antigen ligase family protein [Blastocatellia bacterium]|nr:O-antigen ligase family protein [Blastocatellia bacterium]
MSSNAATQSALPRRALAAWLGPLPALSAVTAVAVTSGGEILRALLLGGAVWLMTLPLLSSLEAGLLAIMIFEPLRGLLRRAQFLFVEYTTTDPIHLLTPAVTILAFAILLWLRRSRLFLAQPLARPVTLLACVFILQVFNPTQGALFVGLSGAMFILIPVAWFYFGQAIRPDFMATAMRLIVVMGLICSLHGIYQLVEGYPDFENYWIEHTDHYESIAVGRVTRALATFNSAEEWGRYIQYGALIAFGFALGVRGAARRGGWAAAAVALSGMLLITGQRTAIFGLMLGLGVMILLGAGSWRGVVGRVALMLMAGLIVLAVAKPPSADEMWDKSSDDRVETMLSHAARGTLAPTKEGSLQERFRIWTYLATTVIPAHPLGTGLGAGTVAAARFATVEASLYPIDSFVAVLLVGCSLPVALLFLWILGRAALLAVRAFRRAPPETPVATVRRIAASIMPMLILNSFFGLTFSIYSAAPIAWLLVGWISAETAREDGWLRETLGRQEISVAGE